MGMTKIAGKDYELLKVTRTGYICASTENLEFFDTIDGVNVNTNLWNQSVSGMTITQAASQLNVNATAATTANAYAILSSIQNFFLTSTNPLYIRMSTQASLWNLPANTTMEFGWGTVATNAAPTDGVFIRAVNGALSLVLNNNGVEQVQSLVGLVSIMPDGKGNEGQQVFGLPAVNTNSEFMFNIYGQTCKLYIDNAYICELSMPTSWPAVVNNNRQPIFFRVYNGASIPGASPTFKLGQMSVQNINAQFEKPFSHKLNGMGRHAVQNPGNPFTQITNWTNSTEPALATLSNTAAGYTTLGGQFAFAAPAGALTDFALFGFQVPAGFQLYITDVSINSMNGAIQGGAAGAAVATTPTMLQWALAVNSSAVSLATADGAGTWAPRRLALGTQGFLVGDAVGLCRDPISRNFDISPLCAEGGRFVHVIVRVPIGTATANQTIRGTVHINGYFE
jgi:hypothetical protein